jgi:hypothetical protein
VSGSGALVPGEGVPDKSVVRVDLCEPCVKIERPCKSCLAYSEDNLHPAGRLVTSSWFDSVWEKFVVDLVSLGGKIILSTKGQLGH